jgi:hypothetical protein
VLSPIDRKHRVNEKKRTGSSGPDLEVIARVETKIQDTKK